MIAWGSTPANNSVTGLVALLNRADWTKSDHIISIRDTLRPLLDHPDETIRMLATPGLPVLVATNLKDELRTRLATEEAPGVRARLVEHLLKLAPHDIDDLLGDLSQTEQWPTLSPAPEPAEQDTESDADTDDFTIRLLIGLDLRHHAPFAASLLDRWMNSPLDHRRRANRTCVFLRDYLNMPAPNSTRAFALLSAPVPKLTIAWHEALTATSATPQPDTVRASATAAGELAQTVAREIHFASGALSFGETPAAPATPAFAAHAFPVLEALSAISHPAVVHEVVQTLTHLSHQDPRRALLAITTAATPGHGYQWEPLAADAVVKVIDLYAAEHRDLLMSDPECLTGLRRLLESFVRTGSDQAIERALAIDELLR